MAPTEEKCVCQICTCGKHRCRHCTDPPYDIHVERHTVSEASEYRSQYLGHGDTDQPRSAKRKQWEKSPEQMKKIYKSYPTIKEDKENRSSVASGSAVQSPIPSTRTESYEARSDTTSEVATEGLTNATEDTRLLNRDPLRNKPINTMPPHDPLKDMSTEELLAQIARPILIKPMDNLKTGGTMELMTTHQHDFPEKSIVDRPTAKRPHTALKSSLYAEDIPSGYSSDLGGSQSESKVKPIAPKLPAGLTQAPSDSSMISTDLIKGHSDVSYAASDATTFDRSGFETSTIASQDGQEITAVKRGEPANLLKTQFPIADSLKAVDNQQSLRPFHERKKWDQSSLYRDTTLRHDFKPWEINRPPLKKPKDSLRNEGLMDLQTTSRTQFTEKIVGRVKPHQWRPKTSFRLEGEFDGRTVNSEVYKGFSIQRVPLHKPPVGPTLSTGGSFANETTTASDYKGWVVARPQAEQKQNAYYEKGEARSHPSLLPSIPGAEPAKEVQSTAPPVLRSDSLLAQERLLPQGQLDAKQMHADYHGWATNGTSPYKSHLVYNSQAPDNGNVKTSKEFSYTEHPEKLSSAKPGHEHRKAVDSVFKEALESEESKAVYVGPMISIQDEKNVDDDTLSTEKNGHTSKEVEQSESKGKSDHASQDKLKTTQDVATLQQADLQTDDHATSDTISQIPKISDENRKQSSSFLEPISERQAAGKSSASSDLREHSGFRYSAQSEGRPEIEMKTTSKTHFQKWDIDRPVPVKHKDNLRQSGKMEFETTNTTEFAAKGKGERPDQVRHYDNIKQEGEMKFETTNAVMFAERRPNTRPQQVRHADNIKQEGEMVFNTTNTAMFGEKKLEDRPVPVKHHDNIKQEGKMELITSNVIDFSNQKLDARPKQVKYKDNLKQEGSMEMITTNSIEFPEKVPDARPEPVKYKDNLMQEGELDLMSTSRAAYAERQPEARPIQVRYKDNLKQEGSMEMITTNSTEFKERPLDSRPQPIRQKDNLKQEGRMEMVTTNITEFKERQMDSRPRPIRQKDNLKQEGNMQMVTTMSTEFKERPLDARPQPIRQKDNIKQEGEMQMVTTNSTEFKERPMDARPQAIRQKDNIKQEGDMQMVTTNSVEFPERPVDGRPSQIRHQDHIKTEGKMELTTTSKTEFEMRRLDARPQPIRQKDNIKLEGNMELVTSNAIEFPDRNFDNRSKPILHQDHIKQEGSGELRAAGLSEIIEYHRDGKPNPIRHKDHMMEKGAMELSTTSRADYAGMQGEGKLQSIRQKDNIIGEGIMTMTTTSIADYAGMQGEGKLQSIKQKDNIIGEGIMTMTTTTGTSYPEQALETRPKPVRYKDNLKADGGMQLVTSNAIDFPERKLEDKPTPIKYKDNIKIEGEMSLETTNAAEFKEKKDLDRPVQVKHSDNIKQEGKMELYTTNAAMFPERNLDDRPKPVKHKDNIKQEGKMELHTTNADMFQNVRGERPKPIKYSDNLKYSGVLFTSKKTAGAIIKNKTEKSKQEKSSKSVTTTAKAKNSETAGRTENDVKSSKKSDSSVMDDSSSDVTVISKQALMKDDSDQRAIRVIPESTNEQAPATEPSKQEAKGAAEQIANEKEQKSAPKETISTVEPAQTVIVPQKSGIKTEPKQAVDHIKQILNESDIDNLLASKENKDFFDQSNKYFGISDGTTISSHTLPKARQPRSTQQQSWAVVKPTTPVRRQDNLHLKGTIDYKTTTQSSYAGHYTPKIIRAKRPQSSLKLYENGTAESAGLTLTDKSTFQKEKTRNGRMVSKSHSNLAVNVSPSKTWKKEGTIRFTGDMDFNTTHRTTYNGLQSSRSESNLHAISESRMAAKDNVANRSTSQLMRSTGHGLFGSQEPFTGTTTYRCSFAAARPGGGGGVGVGGSRNRCPATELEKNNSKYEFRKEINGHKYYLPLVES